VLFHLLEVGLIAECLEKGERKTKLFIPRDSEQKIKQIISGVEPVFVDLVDTELSKFAPAQLPQAVVNEWDVERELRLR
jgi:hypothetical protein